MAGDAGAADRRPTTGGSRAETLYPLVAMVDDPSREEQRRPIASGGGDAPYLPPASRRAPRARLIIVVAALLGVLAAGGAWLMRQPSHASKNAPHGSCGARDCGSYPSEVGADAPRAYWRLGEGAGTAAVSTTGAGAAIYLAGVTLGQPGVVTHDTDTSVALDGGSGAIRTADSVSLDPTAGLSLEAWIRPSAPPEQTATIMRKDGQFLLRLTAQGAVLFRLWKGGRITESSTPPNAVTPAAWNHVVATWDGSAMLIYVNGERRAAGTLAQPIDVAHNDLYVGSSDGSYDWLKSDVDEVAIYGAALPAARVQAHRAAAGVVAAGPLVRLDAPADGSTMDRLANFGGSASAIDGDSRSVTVRIYAGSRASGSVLRSQITTRHASGTFSVRASPPLPAGVYTARAEQIGSARSVGRSAARTFTVDATAAPVMLAAGDIAACDTSGDEATAKLLDRLPGTVASVGDHVYEYATAADFRDCYDTSWGRHKARTKPVIGDHEYFQKGASAYFDYFGAAAGDRTKGYYSYDIGSWHVVVTNTNCAQIGGCAKGSPEERWLRADLAAHPARCTLLYLHDPRFSSGRIHGGDPEMQDLWKAAYDNGVELVVSGNDHLYERFSPQTPAGRADAVRGIRQFVVGTGGRSHYDFRTIQPHSKVHDNRSFGVLKLSLQPGTFGWRFIPVAGATFSDSGSAPCH